MAAVRGDAIAHPPKRAEVVIVGAGVVGASTAFHLARDHGIRSLVLESNEPAGAASGKAGGFLARDWTEGSPKHELVRASFGLFPALAAELGDDVQFRMVDTRSVVADTRRAGPAGLAAGTASGKRAVPWLDGRQFGAESMGSASDGDTAQVHPGLLTLALLRRARELAGTTVLRASAESFEFCDGVRKAAVTAPGARADAAPHAVRAVVARGTFQEATLDPSRFRPVEGLADREAASPWSEIPGSNPGEKAATRSARIEAGFVVICAGPWSASLAPLLAAPGTASPPAFGVSGAKAHSVVLLPAPGSPREALLSAPCALFLDYVADDASAAESPEVYPRPDGSVYVCGAANDDPLPGHAGEVAPAPGAAARLHGAVGTLSSSLRGASLQLAQACFLPLSDDGEPAVGPVQGLANAAVGTAHGCWGILMAPATGRWLAAAAAGADANATVVDLTALSPARFGAATRRPVRSVDTRSAAHSGEAPPAKSRA